MLSSQNQELDVKVHISIYLPRSGLAIVNDVLIIRIMLALSMSQAQLDSYCGADDGDGWHRHGYNNCIQKNILQIRLVFGTPAVALSLILMPHPN